MGGLGGEKNWGGLPRTPSKRGGHELRRMEMTPDAKQCKDAQLLALNKLMCTVSAANTKIATLLRKTLLRPAEKGSSTLMNERREGAVKSLPKDWEGI